MPAFIETQYPIARLSAEAYKERKAGASQTLTGLGKWWGRKPLILVQAAIHGMLMPASIGLRCAPPIFGRSDQDRIAAGHPIAAPCSPAEAKDAHRANQSGTRGSRPMAKPNTAPIGSLRNSSSRPSLYAEANRLRRQSPASCDRMDKAKAVTASTQKLARLVYTTITRGEQCVDQGQAYVEQQHEIAPCATSCIAPSNREKNLLAGRCLLKG